jgi:hypothetical protein
VHFSTDEERDMAKLKAVLFLITQNPMSTVPKWVPEYHAELIVAKYGEAAAVADEAVMEFDIPDLDTEIERLREYYGVDPETNIGIFDSVYGRSHIGKRKFAEDFHAAHVEDAPKAAEGKPSKAAKAAKKDGGEAGTDGGENGGATDPLES